MNTSHEDEYVSKVVENQQTKLLPKHNKRKYKRFACCIKYEVGPNCERFDSDVFAQSTKNKQKAMTNIIVLANPLSGGGRTARFLTALKQSLAGQLNMDLVTATNPKDLETECDKVKLQDYDCIVICGGDGTINMAINAIFKNPANVSKTKIAILNAGSGNDFHGSINGVSAAQIPDRMQNPAYYAVDCGHIKYWSPRTEKEESLYFMSSVGFGVSADVVVTADRWFKFLKGARYTVAGFVEIVKNKFVEMDIYIDGQLFKKDYQLHLLHIQNTQTCGGSMQMCPFAKVDDGMLDIVMLGYTGSRWNMLDLFNKIKAGGLHIYNPLVPYYQSKKIRLEFKEDIVFQADGEVFQVAKYLEIECVPKALNVLY